MSKQGKSISRRYFIDQTVLGTGFLAASGSAFTFGRRAEAAENANPFAYDVDRILKTNPKLLHYTEERRFECPRKKPRRMVLGPGNRLYIAAQDGVCVLDTEGNLVRQIDITGQARCVAVAADETVYVGLRGHVEVFNKSGSRTAQWESPGKKTWFTGLAAGENEVFAADAGNRAIVRYDRSGKLLGHIGKRDKEREIPGLILPSPYLDVKLGKDGLLRVNNPGRHRVEVYSIDGDLELSWGKPSAGIEGFCGCCNPIGLAELSNGRWLTCEKGLPRVKVYSAEGVFECVVAGTESFPENSRAGSVLDKEDGMLGGLDAASDAEGIIYVLDLVAGNVRVMRRKEQV